MIKNRYYDILECTGKGEKVCMVTKLVGTEGTIGRELHKELVAEDHLEDVIQEALMYGIPKCHSEEESHTIAEPSYPEERLVVLGGGHIALPLVEFAAKTGFQVTVVDDRPSFANTKRFPLAKHVICDDFQHALETLHIKKSDYVVIITRGHRHDSECLQKICQGEEPKYVGLIGSRKRIAIVKDTLEVEGCDRQRLERVHTPIGLNIGAITPEEIAISILSELILSKRLGGTNRCEKNCSDIDYDVLKTLSEEIEVPKAILTVISTKGSTPRGPGAKMLVYQEGRILGSIGGGCSEAAVIGEARQMIGTKTFKLVDIDLTGEVAEEEGMVCGGIMTVLIEDFVG